MAVLYDSSGVLIPASTVLFNQGRSGLLVREVVADTTTAAGTIATAGDNTILTSAATAIYVYAVSLAQPSNSTVSPTAGSSAVILRLQSGTTGATVWRQTYYQSTQNGFWDSVFVNPPSYLFKTAAGGLLNMAATSTGANYNVAAWRE